ncbi:MAG: hypothetical protein WD077_11615 [Bacteroidia bacterium]
MNVFKSRYLPKRKNKFVVLQEYASQNYFLLFTLFMLVLFYRLVYHMPILWTGVIGIALLIIISNFIAIVNMKRKPVMIGFEGPSFFIMSVHDLVFNRDVETFPIPYANARFKNGQLTITYFDKILELKQEDWPDWEHIKINFM